MLLLVLLQMLLLIPHGLILQLMLLLTVYNIGCFTVQSGTVVKSTGQIYVMRDRITVTARQMLALLIVV